MARKKEVTGILDNGMGTEEMAVLNELDEFDTDRELSMLYGGRIAINTMYGGMNFN